MSNIYSKTKYHKNEYYNQCNSVMETRKNICSNFKTKSSIAVEYFTKYFFFIWDNDNVTIHSNQIKQKIIFHYGCNNTQQKLM